MRLIHPRHFDEIETGLQSRVAGEVDRSAFLRSQSFPCVRSVAAPIWHATELRESQPKKGTRAKRTTLVAHGFPIAGIAASSGGLEADLKPFHPHVTVGRASGISAQALRPFLRKYADADFGMFEVTGFDLFSSVLARQGAIHRVEMHQDF